MSIKWICTTEKEKWTNKEVGNSNPIGYTLRTTGERSQTVGGFGGCFNELGWIALLKTSEKNRQDVMNELFNPESGCRFNFCRMPIGASDYADIWYSHNETEGDFAMENFSIERDYKYLMPYIKSAKALNSDIELFASPWSPPTWMKEPQIYNGGRIRMDKETLDAYALYFKKFLEAYKDEGIGIQQLHIQNEPFAEQRFPSCLWSGEQFRVFIKDHLGPLFENEGIDTEIWLGTLNGPEQMKFLPTGDMLIDLFDEYIDHIFFDEKARSYISGIGYQWAGRESIQRTRASYPDVKLIQTENECGDGTNNWKYARYIFNLMTHYMRNGISSYVYWNMVLEPQGKSTWGWKQNSMITIEPSTGEVIYNPEFYVMKHFSSFVEKGAFCMKLEGEWAGASAVFENPDGSTIVIVGNNVDYIRMFSFESSTGAFSAELEPYSFNTFVM